MESQTMESPLTGVEKYLGECKTYGIPTPTNAHELLTKAIVVWRRFYDNSPQYRGLLDFVQKEQRRMNQDPLCANYDRTVLSQILAGGSIRDAATAENGGDKDERGTGLFDLGNACVETLVTNAFFYDKS